MKFDLPLLIIALILVAAVASMYKTRQPVRARKYLGDAAPKKQPEPPVQVKAPPKPTKPTRVDLPLFVNGQAVNVPNVIIRTRPPTDEERLAEWTPR